MNRKLTKQEAKLCREGINNRNKRIKELETELRYFEEFEAFNKKWAKYIESKEEQKKEKRKMIIDGTLSGLKEEIAHEQRAIKIEQDQLKNGVEVKKMTGVE